MNTLVLFDADCWFCRMLADFGQKRARGQLTFLAWQDFRRDNRAAMYFSEKDLAEPLSEVVVIENQMVMNGTDAWVFLLEKHPNLRGLSWIAAKIGLVPSLASSLRRGGHAIRMLCGRCRSR